jgi:uncharacterized protein
MYLFTIFCIVCKKLLRSFVQSNSGDIVTEPVFEWYTDIAGKYRFRLKATNGEIIAVSEAYNSKESCIVGIESVKKNASIAKIVETKE